MIESSGRACGKLILAGEHAVVYGVPAIALGIDRGAVARARRAPSGVGPCRLRVAGWSVDVKDDGDEELARAFRALLQSARTSVPLEVDASTELPAGEGLGCSAALGVAIARAVAPDASDDLVREHAMAWERVFHGNPSGVDAAVSALGGVVQFAREDGRSRVEPINTRGSFVLAVGRSGVAAATRVMVERVAQQRAERPVAVEATFRAIRAIVAGVRTALESGDRAVLGHLIDDNHRLLRTLSLSTPSIDSMCAAAREAGALGAKVTGAGGGGCVLALAESQAVAERILSAWSAQGFGGFVTTVQARPRAHVGTHAA